MTLANALALLRGTPAPQPTPVPLPPQPAPPISDEQCRAVDDTAGLEARP